MSLAYGTEVKMDAERVSVEAVEDWECRPCGSIVCAEGKHLPIRVISTDESALRQLKNFEAPLDACFRSR